MKRQFLLLPLAVILAAATAFPQMGEHWVATWGTAVLQTNVPNPSPQVAANAPARAGGRGGLRTFNNQTVRMVVNTSIGGRSVRILLSNTFGQNRLKIGAAHIALRDKDSAILPASDRTLMFSGSPSATIPAGGSFVSDPVDLAVPAVGDLVVSLYLPEDSGPPTYHSVGLHTTYISGEGDFTGKTNFEAERTSNSWYFLAGVDVLAPADASALVAFGDSITDGTASTNDANADWPSMLAKRLQANGVHNLAVVNQGISGNRVLRDGSGPSVLSRFDRDVLSQPGVKYLLFLEAINDIGNASRPNQDPVTTEEIIAVYKQMIERAHMHGIKVIGGTLTPFEGAGYYSEKGEEIRMAVNEWIRTTGMLDGVVDFDAVTRDPANPKTFRSDYNLRDHLHPNDTGYKAMAEAIDLSLFGVKQ